MDVIGFLDSVLPEGWDHDAEYYGLEFLLTCPCGYQIEQDGECPSGCVSPLKEKGLI